MYYFTEGFQFKFYIKTVKNISISSQPFQKKNFFFKYFFLNFHCAHQYHNIYLFAENIIPKRASIIFLSLLSLSYSLRWGKIQRIFSLLPKKWISYPWRCDRFRPSPSLLVIFPLCVNHGWLSVLLPLSAAFPRRTWSPVAKLVLR